MRAGRLLLVAGVIIIIGAILIGGLMMLRNRQATVSTVPAASAEVIPTPEVLQGVVEIVLAAQNIPRGMRITRDNNAVVTGTWPEDALPAGAITDPEAVYERIARVDIALGMPVLESMLTEQPGALGGVGSEAALQVPTGMVAYALPVARYSTAAWALRPGDRVDVILSLLLVDLDQEFQSQLVNQVRCLTSITGAEGCEGFSGPLGRLETLPAGWLVDVLPSEAQRPRLVTQLTLQNVLVLQIGDWPERAPVTPTVELEEAVAGPTPTPSPQREIVPLTLAVSQQDALVLEHARAIGARITLVLRSAGDNQIVVTEPVTLQYLMQRFNIQMPPKLPYGVAPAVEELERIGQGVDAGRYRGGMETVSEGSGE